MSELKAFDITVAEEGYCEGIVKYRRAVYDKSEADKVIAELKHSLDLATDECCSISERAVKQLRHQKYKRCLDKAEMCQARYDEEDVKVNGYGVSWGYISKEMKYWERWRWRWLELAEKFKETKFPK